MLIEVKVPQLPESITEATLTAWKKRQGDFAQRDENLVDLETDKIALEIPAPQNGMLVEILVADGSIVTSGQLLARIDTSMSNQPSVFAGAEPSVTPDTSITSQPSFMAMPSAEKLAAEKGIDLTTVKGSGRDGRILKEDVQTAVDTQNPALSAGVIEGLLGHFSNPAENPAPVSEPVIAPFQPVLPPSIEEKLSAVQPVADVSVIPPEPETIPQVSPAKVPSSDNISRERREPMSRLRQAVAGRLILSQQTNAILTTFNEVNMQPLLDLRSRYKERFQEEHGIKLGIMSFFVKAVIQALKKYPVLNARIEGTDIVYNDYYDIGVAIGAPRGLIVPVLRDADKLSIAAIEQKITDFGTRARDGRITMEEMNGGTYTITNGGVFGSMMSTPIINPPQSAILGMHATTERPVVENGTIVARPMMYLAQSYDHRLIDGREAVLSLIAIKEIIEDPARLLLDI